MTNRRATEHLYESGNFYNSKNYPYNDFIMILTFNINYRYQINVHIHRFKSEDLSYFIKLINISNLIFVIIWIMGYLIF